MKDGINNIIYIKKIDNRLESHFDNKNGMESGWGGHSHNLLDLQDLLAENVTSQSQADRVNRNA